MAFATLYQRIDVVKSDLSEADDFATVQPCLKLIRSLHDYITVYIRPMYLSIQTNRIAYALQCVNRAYTSLKGLIQTMRVHDQVQDEFEVAEKRMHNLIPKSLLDPKTPEKALSPSTDRPRKRSPRMKEPKYDTPSHETVHVKKTKSSGKTRSVTPPQALYVRRVSSPSETSSRIQSVADKVSVAFSNTPKPQRLIMHSDSSEPARKPRKHRMSGGIDLIMKKANTGSLLTHSSKLMNPQSSRRHRLSLSGKPSHPHVLDSDA